MLRIITVIFALTLFGCSDPGPRVYDVAKDKSSPQPSPMTQAPFANNAGDNRMDPSLIDTPEVTNKPDWVKPSSWTEKPASSVRVGSFVFEGPAGEVDISLTTFPGDVGGLLANINRWRGQINLDPISEAEIPALIEEFEISHLPAIRVNLTGPTLSTDAAIVMIAGNSWFIKATGPTASIEANKPAFGQFLTSLHFAESHE